MKENSIFKKLGKTKGGSMYKKILSVLVIGSFVLSNVCFAMPVASMQAEAVDNMALQNFLQNPTPENFDKFKAERKNLAKYMDLLAKAGYKGEEVDSMRAMWAEIYKGPSDLQGILQFLTSAEEFEQVSGQEVVIRNAAGEEETFAVVGNQVTFAQGITQQVEKMLQRTEKGSRVAQAKGINPKTGQPFANEQEKEQLLTELSVKQAATATEKASAEDQAIFTQAIDQWEAQNELAFKNGNITQGQYGDAKIRIGQMRAKNAKGNLRFADAQVLSDTVFVLHQNPDVANPDEPAYFAREMKDATKEVSEHLAQLADHESVIEQDLAGHDAQLEEGAEQRSRWGNEAVDAAGPAMRNDIINPKLAEKPAEPTVEVSNITEDEALTKEDLEAIAKATGLEEVLKNDKEKFTGIATNYVKTSRTTSIIQPMVTAQGSYYAKRAMRSPFSGLTKEERQKAVADYISQGGTINFYFNGAFVTKDGETVPNTVLAEIMEISEYTPTPTTGPAKFNIIATGENAKIAEAILGKRGVDKANKWSVISSEQTLIDQKVSPKNIAVIHTNADVADAEVASKMDRLSKAGVFYLQLAKEILEANANGNAALGMYDGLTIALAAINHKMEMVLSGAELDAYRDLRDTGGRFELSAIEVADKEDYQVIHQEYEKFVSLLIQA